MRVATWRSCALLALGMIATGCSKHTSQAPGSAAGAGGDGDAQKFLNIYSWSDYIAPDTIPNFEKLTGIKVRYDIYDSNEVLETKLLTGRTNYDIVVPTGYFFERQVRAGVFRRLDPALLPNRVNLDPEIMKRLALHDPGNEHGVPYLWSSTGIGYNEAQVHARLGANLPTSWALILDPGNAARLKDCGISIVDAASEVISSVLIYLGRDANSRDERDIALASQTLRKIRPYVRYIDSQQYISDLANGSVCVSLGWSGDILQARARAREAANGVQIAYLVPIEGAMLTVDAMGIPADAPHPRNAQLFLNYLMQPEVIAGVTNFVKYPNGNLASLPFIEDRIKNDRSIYPDGQTRARLLTHRAEPLAYSRLVSREWTRFRTGE